MDYKGLGLGIVRLLITIGIGGLIYGTIKLIFKKYDKK